MGETIRKHIVQFQSEHPEVVEILSRLYADDLSCGSSTVEEALEIYRKSKVIMQKGGFNLRKWCSNNAQVLQEINKLEMPEQNIKLEGSKIVEDDESYSKYAIGEPSGSENNKVLGVKWDSDADQIKLELTHVVEYSKSIPRSKRSVLSIAAKIFDPLGLLSLYTVNLKSFFQELCINKGDWDDELQGSYRQRFYCLLSELEKPPSIQISRCLFKEGKTVESIEIHGFFGRL